MQAHVEEIKPQSNQVPSNGKFVHLSLLANFIQAIDRLIQFSLEEINPLISVEIKRHTHTMSVGGKRWIVLTLEACVEKLLP